MCLMFLNTKPKIVTKNIKNKKGLQTWELHFASVFE